MSDAFITSLKWYVLSLSIIIGTAAFMISEQHKSMGPIFIGICGYGVAYIMVSFWKAFREKVLFVSLSVFLGLTMLSYKFAMGFYILFGFGLTMDPNLAWAACVGLLGIPIMTIVFYRLR